MVSPLFPVVSLSVDRPRRNKKLRFSKTRWVSRFVFLARMNSLHRMNWFFLDLFCACVLLRSWVGIWFVSSFPYLLPSPSCFRSPLRVRSNFSDLRALGRGFCVLRVLVYSPLCGFAVEIEAGPVFSEGCSPRSPRCRSVAE